MLYKLINEKGLLEMGFVKKSWGYELRCYGLYLYSIDVSIETFTVSICQENEPNNNPLKLEHIKYEHQIKDLYLILNGKELI